MKGTVNFNKTHWIDSITIIKHIKHKHFVEEYTNIRLLCLDKSYFLNSKFLEYEIPLHKSQTHWWLFYKFYNSPYIRFMLNNYIHTFGHMDLLYLSSILTRPPIVTQLFAQPTSDSCFPLPNVHFIMQPG